MVTVEDMVDKLKLYSDKDFESLGIASKAKVYAIFGKAAINFMEFTVKHADIMEQGQLFEQEMDETHGQAHGMVLLTFEVRLKLLNAKFNELERLQNN